MPYIYLALTFSFIGLWSNTFVQSTRLPNRAIANDQSLLNSELGNTTTPADKLKKLKNKTWNKVMGTHDFENFNDQEYFRWMEIYKDGNAQLSNLNPVRIEQKMALIEVINRRLDLRTHSLENKIHKEIQSINFYKIKKIKNHFTELGINSFSSQTNIYNFATELMILLKGPPLSLMEYYTANKTPKMNKKIMGMVQEDILSIGLKGVLGRVPEENLTKVLMHAKTNVKDFLNNKSWKHFAKTYDYEWLHKIKLSDELLEKIIIFGLDQYDQELIEQLKKQNMVDQYERFRKTFRPIAFSICYFFYFERFSQNELNDNINSTDFYKKTSEIILEAGL